MIILQGDLKTGIDLIPYRLKEISLNFNFQKS